MTDTRTSAERVYEELIRRIATRALRAGQRLPTIPLAEEFGVSRTPVIEALRLLANDGIVILSPGSGASLVAPSFREIEEVFAVRATLERMAAGLAARDASSVDICRMEEAIDEEERWIREKDLLGNLRAGRSFHELLARSSGNSFLARHIVSVLSSTFVFQILFEQNDNENFDLSPTEHREILEAIRQGDAHRAERLVD
jgi:DNA-binding GntR family transcriptional regulator